MDAQTRVVMSRKTEKSAYICEIIRKEMSRGQRFSGCLLHLCPVSQMDGYEVHQDQKHWRRTRFGGRGSGRHYSL